MDLSPLYELRGRLRAAMIAGTNLLSEDFRLKRAAEAFAPLEQASPVFAKIGQMTKSLLSSDQKDREGALLDTITLVDAVLCTQGAVAVKGEVEAIRGSSWGSTITNAPYSVVKTLLDSLLNSGSGRYSYVLDTHEERPELFQDYRIKAAMVQALGASYAELADTVAEWLKNEDASLLPLLQKDFDPKGKKEMVRRVRVMAAIDAREANPFFVKVLPDAEKEVRLALIYALRNSSENVDLLLELAKTEKGNAKKMVYYALASMEDARAADAFAELYKKKPVEAMQYLVYVETKWASDFVGEKLKEQLEAWAAKVADDTVSKEQAELLDAALAALPGKSGEAVCEAFRMAVGLGDRLGYSFDKKTTGIGERVAGVIAAAVIRRSQGTDIFQNAIPYLLHQALYSNPDETLCDLALELYGEEGKQGGRKNEFFPMAVTAMLLTREDCCDWLEEQLWKKGLVGESLKREMVPLLARGLNGLVYDERKGVYALQTVYTYLSHPSGEPMPRYFYPVKQKIVGRFMDILIKCDAQAIDNILKQCIDSRNEEYCSRLGDYFYDKAIRTADNRQYLESLRRCHYPKCEGLARSYFRSQNTYSFYDIKRYAAMLPGDGQAKYTEMKSIFEMFKSGKLTMYRNTWDEAQFLDILEDLKRS